MGFASAHPNKFWSLALSQNIVSLLVVPVGYFFDCWFGSYIVCYDFDVTREMQGIVGKPRTSSSVASYCKTTNFYKRLIFVNFSFSWFVNTNFRKFGPSADQNMFEKAFNEDEFS